MTFYCIGIILSGINVYLLCNFIFFLNLVSFLDWSHSTTVSGQTHPEAQETVAVGRSGPLGQHQHQPGVWERLPQWQSPQSCCCPTTPGPLTVQPHVPGPLSLHPKLQRHHCAEQHSATHSDVQTELRPPESDCQRHELRGEQGRGEGRRKKRRAPEDLTRRYGAAGRTVLDRLPSLFFPTDWRDVQVLWQFTVIIFQQERLTSAAK